MDEPKLTLKQEKFICEYLISGNASDAALKAGYSKKTAFRIGQENLQKPAIRARIAAEMQKIKSAKIATAEEVLELLTTAARGEMTEEALIVDLNNKIHVKEKKISPKDRVKSLELLGKRHLLWTDKTKVETVGDLVIDFGRDDDANIQNPEEK